MIDGARGRDETHDVATTAIRAEGQAATDDFAERGEIRRDAEKFLRAAVREAKARHDFVEDEQRARFVGDRAKALQIAFFRRDEAHVADNGLENHRSDFVTAFVEKFLCGGEIVVRKRDGCARDGLWNTGAVGHAERRETAARFRQKIISSAVVAAFELHDEIALCETARNAKCAHDSFGAA